MRAILQRVLSSSVTVDRTVVGEIGPGLLVLVGFGKTDTTADLTWMLDKIVNLRIFDDGGGKMNHSLLDTGGALLAVSQFTLFADTRKGRRPSFVGAGEPALAKKLYEEFCDR